MGDSRPMTINEQRNTNDERKPRYAKMRIRMLRYPRRFDGKSMDEAFIIGKRGEGA